MNKNQEWVAMDIAHLLRIERRARRVLSTLKCDGPEARYCRACDLQEALNARDLFLKNHDHQPRAS